MNNILKNILIVIGMGVSKWFAALAFLFVLGYLSLFMAESSRIFLISILTILIGGGLGFLYAYFTKFLLINLKLKILIGLLLVATVIFQIYTNYLRALETQNTLEILRGLGGILISPVLLFDINIVVVLYALAFMTIFVLYLWKK